MKKFKIDIKEMVELNGLKQKIHIIGHNEENPVLLSLHGGPGISNRHGVLTRDSDFCDNFIVVAWDQRGTGGSYFGCDRETLTVDNMVEDANALTIYLKEKFNKKKIFIIGGSWGTTLGSLLAQRHPENVAAYIGYGQVVEGALNESISYDFCVEKATEANDEESLKILRELKPPVGGLYDQPFEGMMKQRKILAKYGGHNVKKMGYWKSTVKPLLLSKEFGLKDKIGLIKGYKFVLKKMWPEVCACNLLLNTTYEVPYFIFQGRMDKNTPSDLVQDYFDKIIAPEKDLLWFENSAHGVIGEEHEKFKSEMEKRFLRINETL